MPPDAKTGKPGDGVKPDRASPPTAIPPKIQDAEKVAREILDKVAKGRITQKDIERLGLALDDVRQFLKEVERARSARPTGEPGNASQPPPTYAELIEELNKTVKQPKKPEDAKNATGAGEGKGTLRGVMDAVKDSVDLEYQDVLEEYYRSLADPNWRKRK